MVTYEVVPFEEFYTSKGFAEWQSEYIEETANTNIGVASGQIARYLELEAKGQLLCMAALDGEELVGGVILLVTQSRHYAFPMIGVDSFYLRKPWRKGDIGLRLMRFVKETAVKEGAPGFMFMAPPDGPLDRLCRLRGMAHTHNAYWCKAL